MKEKKSAHEHSRHYQRSNPIYLALSSFFADIFKNDCDVCAIEDLTARYVASEGNLCEDAMRMVGIGHSEFVLLVGHTGSGKTTSIRYVYNMEENTPYFWENVLIIPILFNDSEETDSGSIEVSEIRALMIRQVYAANMVLTERIKKSMGEEFCQTDFAQQFIEFVRTTDRGALKNCEDDFGDDYVQIKKNFEVNNEFSYMLYYMKFLLSRPHTITNGVLFVVDGIEMLELSNQAIIIEEFKRHQTKLLRGSSDHCFVNVIIAVRPYVVRLFNAKHRPKATIFSQPPVYKTPIKMEYVLRKLHQSPMWVSNNTTEYTYSLCLSVACRMSGKMQDYILQLNNFDHRRERVTYWNVLSNSEYVFRNKSVITAANYARDVLNISVDDFVIESTTVLRAIGCRDNLIYKDMDDPEMVIVNVLDNLKVSDDHDLIGLLILRYFSFHGNQDDIYGEQVYINRSEFMDDLKRLYPHIGDNILEVFTKRLQYFINRKLIYPAYNDEQNLTTNEALDCVDNKYML